MSKRPAGPKGLPSHLRIGEGSVLVDLFGLSFIDSSGFNVRVAAHHRFESEGRRLFITGMSPRELQAIQAAGLDTVLHLEPPPGVSRARLD